MAISILAHRGYWHQPADKNSLNAMIEAWESGFGIETDIRDQDGKLVISHDPPAGPNMLTLDAFLAAYAKHGTGTKLALNIKADGLQAALKQALERHGVTRGSYFVFDMAVPDALDYLRHDMPTFTRHSDVEAVPSYLSESSGVWLDAFRTDWFGPDTVLDHLRAGRDVALVSPELHKREHHSVWAEWRAIMDLGKTLTGRIMLCTDYPTLADEYFNG